MSFRSQQKGSLVSRFFKNSVVESDNLQQEDVIIVTMGPTGSGKSTFIETITGIRGIVGHGLESFTSQITVYKISFEDLPGSDIHFVDTPGFDDTTISDVDIFKMISDWLHKTYRRRIQVTGLLYFHRISDNRMAGAALRTLHLFERLCGKEFNNIVLTTTMWDQVEDHVGYYREEKLKNLYWRAMVDRGSSMRRFTRTRQSAFEVLKPIIEDVRRKALLLQREVEDLGLKINQTSAGQTLSMHFEELVGGNEEKLNRIPTEVRDPLLIPSEKGYQKNSLEMQRTTNDVKRKPPTKFRKMLGFMRRKTPRPHPPPRQENIPYNPRIQDGRVPQPRTSDEVILWEGPSATTSQTPGPSRYGRALVPMPVEEELPPSGQRRPSSSTRPRSPQISNNRAAGSYLSHVRQPEHMNPTTSSPPSPPGGFSRAQSVTSGRPNQIAPAWGQIPPHLPLRSHTIHPGSHQSLSRSRSRASIPHDNGMGSYQGSSPQPSRDNRPPHNRRRRRSRSRPRNDGDRAQSSSQDLPPVPRLPWQEEE